MPPRKNTVFTLYTHEQVPLPPETSRLCPTCINPMRCQYAWKSSEHVIHYFMLCECGSRAKGRLMHARLDKKGNVTK